ncbi:MAG: Rpn family recombination-promoting nuclease/putative transposase [Puniceicoccales bacterium]|jgi:predicted transposase/invertase (TIGR01784 family)|nr:Rpn family recombination-promoting nuclease/putative transposase [Puniceicoccales bacterium]
MIDQQNAFAGSEYGFADKNLGPIEFAKATSDVGFKLMISDDKVATSLINCVLQDVGVDRITPLRIVAKGDPKAPLRGLNVNAMMDYHAITADGRHVVIEMQMVRQDSFDRRALFYAASAFVNQVFLKEENVEKDGQWHFHIKDIYTIQFLDLDCPRHGKNFKTYYCMMDEFSSQKIDGIHMIQIALKGIQNIEFPTQTPLTPINWWYYVIRYAHRFTESELERCRALGMPEEAEVALEHLKFEDWGATDRSAYEQEITEPNAYDLALERQREEGLQEGLQKGEIAGQLKNLIERFIYNENMDRSLQSIPKHSLTKQAVKEIWDQYAGEQKIPQDKTLKNFIELLQQSKVLA